MKLELKRTAKTAEACLGVLEVDGSFECYTLEDPDGAGDRIDAGTYNVITDFSTRFQKIMPLLTGPKVDGRGIRIHCGNTQADTVGCILLGQSEGVNEIEGSRLAFNAFFPKLEAALARGETVTLTVTDETQPNVPHLSGLGIQSPQIGAHLNILQSLMTALSALFHS